MVTFDALLLHLAPDVPDLRQDRGECGRVDRRFVGRRQRRHDVGTLDRPRQECGGCSRVTCGADVDIDDLAFLIDRTKCIAPTATYAYIRLINAPLVPDTTATGTCCFLRQRGELLDPVEDRGRIDQDAAFGEQLSEVSVG